MKKFLGTFKLSLPAGELTPVILGPLLGQYGINLVSFCKEFNNKTKNKLGSKVRVKTIVYENKSYKINISSLPSSTLLINSLKKAKGSSFPNRLSVGNITKNSILKLINLKYLDLYPISKYSLIKMIKGTANSIGIS